MKILSRTITFNEKELRAELNLLEKQFAAYERFEYDVRDTMDLMEQNEDYDRLNEALSYLNATRARLNASLR